MLCSCCDPDTSYAYTQRLTQDWRLSSPAGQEVLSMQERRDHLTLMRPNDLQMSKSSVLQPRLTTLCVAVCFFSSKHQVRTTAFFQTGGQMLPLPTLVMGQSVLGLTCAPVRLVSHQTHERWHHPFVVPFDMAPVSAR